MNAFMPMTKRGMVTSPHYLASTAGLQILQQGGNAFDAAVAVSATLGVVYPHMTGLGGDAFFLIYSAKDRKLTGYNGSGRAAQKATPSFFLEKGVSSIPQRGPLSALTVPGMADAWWAVWQRFGRLSWEQLFSPAVFYAREGFPVSRNLVQWIERDRPLLQQFDGLRQLFMPHGQALQEGQTLIQADLSRTLQQLAGKGRDAFYRGELMKRWVSDLEKQGCLLTEEDFLCYHGDWVEPLKSMYRGWELAEMPPNSQGFSVLMMMNMLEYAEWKEIPYGSTFYYHLMVEVIKRVFYERDRYLSDPDFVSIPLEKLLSKAYGQHMWQDINGTSTATLYQSPVMGQDTAYAAVVDEEGNAVSFIQSLYYEFGSMVMAGETGILLQNRGSFFSLDPEHPNCLTPGKRTFHTLMPAMVLQDGQPYLLLGTQGGEGQPQTQLAILTNVLDYGMDIQRAVYAPRWVYGRTWGEASDSLKLEARIGEEVYAGLMERGHRLEWLQAWDDTVGQAQAIQIDRVQGYLAGVADPRGDGMAIGW